MTTKAMPGEEFLGVIGRISVPVGARSRAIGVDVAGRGTGSHRPSTLAIGPGGGVLISMAVLDLLVVLARRVDHRP